AGTVGHIDVGRIPDLVVLVQHGRPAVTAHARGPHLMDALARSVVVVVHLHVLDAGGLEHLGGIGGHVLAHGQFVGAHGYIHRQHRQTPLVLAVPVQADRVVVVRQHFAEAGHADAPVTGHGQRLLQVGTDVQLGDLARPPRATGTALVAEAAQVAALVSGHVAEA